MSRTKLIVAALAAFFALALPGVAMARDRDHGFELAQSRGLHYHYPNLFISTLIIVALDRSMIRGYLQLCERDQSGIYSALSGQPKPGENL